MDDLVNAFRPMLPWIAVALVLILLFSVLLRYAIVRALREHQLWLENRAVTPIIPPEQPRRF